MTEILQAEDFLDQPEALRRELEGQGALTFDPVPETGLFVASAISDPELARLTGMGVMAWARDNAHIAKALLLAGEDNDIAKAQGVGRAFLDILHRNEGVLSEAIANPDAPRLAVRYDAVTLDPDSESRVQTDSTGYLAALPAELIRRELLPATREDLAVLALTARYLEADKYWERPDDGAWEEDRHFHSSSVGVALASLTEVGRLFEALDYQPDVDITTLVRRGRFALNGVLWLHGETPPDPLSGYPGRSYDAAQLLPTITMDLFGKETEESDTVVGRVEQALVRDGGVARYPGDSYYAPGFTEMLKPGERTSQAEGRLELRNTLSDLTRRMELEARWKLFHSLLSEYWGRRGDQERQRRYLNDNLRHYIPMNGGLRIPELDYKETPDGPWRPNEHTPLIWAQANTLRALTQFARTARGGA